MSNSLRVILTIPQEGFPWDAARTQGNIHYVSRIKVFESFFTGLETKRDIWVE